MGKETKRDKEGYEDNSIKTFLHEALRYARKYDWRNVSNMIMDVYEKVLRGSKI